MEAFVIFGFFVLIWSADCSVQQYKYYTRMVDADILLHVSEWHIVKQLREYFLYFYHHFSVTDINLTKITCSISYLTLDSSPLNDA